MSGFVGFVVGGTGMILPMTQDILDDAGTTVGGQFGVFGEVYPWFRLPEFEKSLRARRKADENHLWRNVQALSKKEMAFMFALQGWIVALGSGPDPMSDVQIPAAAVRFAKETADAAGDLLDLGLDVPIDGGS